MIALEIKPRGRHHCLHVLDEGGEFSETLDYDWQDVIDWCIDQTEQQPKIKRMAYDMWYFTSKQQATKFALLILLRFPKTKLLD